MEGLISLCVYCIGLGLVLLFWTPAVTDSRKEGVCFVVVFSCLNRNALSPSPCPPPLSAHHPPTSVMTDSPSPSPSQELVMKPAASISRGSPGSVLSPPRPCPSPGSGPVLACLNHFMIKTQTEPNKNGSRCWARPCNSSAVQSGLLRLNL